MAVVATSSDPSTPDRRHVIVTDRYFTTVKTCRELMSHNFECVGTLNTLYGGVPKEFLWADGTRVHGAMRFARSGDHTILVQQWQDRGTVAVLSSVHTGVRGGPDETVGKANVYSVKRRVKGRGSDTWSVKDVPVPAAVHCYQSFYGGVDRSDQVCARFCYV
jgi:hypothetical protein